LPNLEVISVEVRRSWEPLPESGPKPHRRIGRTRRRRKVKKEMAYSRRNYNDATFIFHVLPGYGILFSNMKITSYRYGKA